MKIDFVVTWVDGSDPKWLRKKNKYSPSDEIMNTDIRYRDYGTFKYWFRAIEEN
ncbi:capsule biosynthesis protein CapG, partial [Pediococcus acidilactici]